MPGTEIFKLINNQYLKDDYIKSDEEIDTETAETISKAFNENMMNRISSAKANGLPVSDSDYQKFIAYNTFAEQCRAEGRAQKAANAIEIATLKEIEIGGEMKTKIFVRQ